MIRRCEKYQLYPETKSGRARLNRRTKGEYRKMLRKISHRVSVLMMPPAVGAGQRRPVLDVGLGFALMRDRRVSQRTKARAMVIGACTATMLFLLEIVLTRLLSLPPAPVHALEFVALGVGMALFGMLALVKLAPMGVVTRLRYERYRIIPLRPKAQAAGAHDVPLLTAVVRTSVSRLDISMDREAQPYAIIPQRARQLR
jgi:hypothetical protein